MKRFTITLLCVTAFIATVQVSASPIAREKATWTYHHLLVNDGIKEDHVYNLYFKGDSTVDDITYKKCYVKYEVPVHEGSLVEQGLVPMALVRDNDNKTYARFTREVIAESKTLGANSPYSYFVPDDTEEKLILDFTQGKRTDNYYIDDMISEALTICDSDGNKVRALLYGVGDDNGWYDLQEQYHGDLIRCHIPVSWGSSQFDELRFEHIDIEVKGTLYTYTNRIEAKDYVNALGHHEINTFQPLVREGRTWVNTFVQTAIDDLDEEYQGFSYYFSYCFKGDSVVNGVTYKKCYIKYQDEQMAKKETFGCGGSPGAKHLKANASVPSHPGGWNVCALVRAKDMRVYLFEETATEPGVNYESTIANYSLMRAEVKKKYLNCEQVDIAGVMCNKYSVATYGSQFYTYGTIESIGPATGVGTIIEPSEDLPTCMGYSYVGLSHVLDAEGNIIFKTRNYVPSDWTAINDVKVNKLPADNKYYNLHGQEVDIKKAPAGIYIHNGKKIIVK